jgi:NADH dehydrogenase
MLKDGGRVAAGTIVCTIGTVPQTLIENLGLPMRRGAVQVEPDLRVTGRDHLWALGDCASIPNAADDGVAPPTAQFATREALHLAENLRRALRGEATRPFGYRPRAIMATVGHRRAVARLFGFNFRGVPAWLLWRAVYLAKLPTWLRRVQVFFEWSWQALFPADVTQFHYAPYRLADGTRLDKSPAQQEGCTEDEAQRRAGAR